MIHHMVLALAALAAAQSAPAGTSAEQALDQALECRVYVALAKSVHAGDADMVAMDEKLQRYWLKRGDELGAKHGYSPHALRMRELAIQLETERFKPVMLACLAATPKKALR